MSDLNIIIVGEQGSGKSTAARIVVQAMQKAGFNVELMDKDDMSQERFDKCLKAIQGKSVRVVCGNASMSKTTENF